MTPPPYLSGKPCSLDDVIVALQAREFDAHGPITMLVGSLDGAERVLIKGNGHDLRWTWNPETMHPRIYMRTPLIWQCTASEPDWAKNQPEVMVGATTEPKAKLEGRPVDSLLPDKPLSVKAMLERLYDLKPASPFLLFGVNENPPMAVCIWGRVGDLHWDYDPAGSRPDGDVFVWTRISVAPPWAIEQKREVKLEGPSNPSGTRVPLIPPGRAYKATLGAMLGHLRGHVPERALKLVGKYQGEVQICIKGTAQYPEACPVMRPFPMERALVWEDADFFPKWATDADEINWMDAEDLLPKKPEKLAERKIVSPGCEVMERHEQPYNRDAATIEHLERQLANTQTRYDHSQFLLWEITCVVKEVRELLGLGDGQPQTTAAAVESLKASHTNLEGQLTGALADLEVAKRRALEDQQLISNLTKRGAELGKDLESTKTSADSYSKHLTDAMGRIRELEAAANANAEATRRVLAERDEWKAKYDVAEASYQRVQKDLDQRRAGPIGYGVEDLRSWMGMMPDGAKRIEQLNGILGQAIDERNKARARVLELDALDNSVAQGFRQQLAAKDDAINYAYTERNRLVALLARQYPSSLEPNPDTRATEIKDGWNWIVFVDLPTGQASWHLHDRDLNEFTGVPREQGRKWDGHTTPVKWQRVMDMPTDEYAEMRSELIRLREQLAAKLKECAATLNEMLSARERSNKVIIRFHELMKYHGVPSSEVADDYIHKGRPFAELFRTMTLPTAAVADPRRTLIIRLPADPQEGMTVKIERSE